MSNRFSIMVTEFGSDREVELCRLNGDPEPIVKALTLKTLMVHTARPGVSRRSTLRKYTNIRVVDNGED